MRQLLVALFMLVFASTASAKPPEPGTFVVHAIDVGSGLSIFVEGADFTLLYDAGSGDDHAHGDRNRVLAYVRAARPDLRRIDHVIVSHAHRDHINLLPDMLSAYEVLNIWEPGATGSTCDYRLLMERIADEPDATYHHARGQEHPFSAAFPPAHCQGQARPATTVSIVRTMPISPGPIRLGQNASMTIVSVDGRADDLHVGNLVVRLDLGARRILLPGDAGAGRRAMPTSPPEPGSVEARLIECCVAEIRADVLVAPHHGSRSASRTAFLDAVGAAIYVVSAGPRIFAGIVNPDVEVLRQYLLRGSLWRTDINDYGCARNPAKIGPDADSRPGGCENIRISIDEAGAITAAYSDRAD